jgi:hypothetical protein
MVAGTRNEAHASESGSPDLIAPTSFAAPAGALTASAPQRPASCPDGWGEPIGGHGEGGAADDNCGQVSS